MTGNDLRLARAASRWTQEEAASRLNVTQAYLSMVERGARPVSRELASTVLKVFSLSPAARSFGGAPMTVGEQAFKEALGELGYPGFAYLSGDTLWNPAELLLRALNTEDLDARVTEALPWLPFHFPDMRWDWLMRESKLRDRQNRLAYVTTLARDVADARGETDVAHSLHALLSTWEKSRLANEDTLCKAFLSQAERKWLRNHRPSAAKHWNLLTDLKAEDLVHVY